MTLTDFLATDTKILAPLTECVTCKNPITGVHSDDLRMIADGPVHNDCYFKELGDVVEAHPPCGPRRGSRGSSDLL